MLLLEAPGAPPRGLEAHHASPRLPRIAGRREPPQAAPDPGRPRGTPSPTSPSEEARPAPRAPDSLERDVPRAVRRGGARLVAVVAGRALEFIPRVMSRRALALALVAAVATGCNDYTFSPVGHCLIQPGSVHVKLSDV